MKSKQIAGVAQAIIGDNGYSTTDGWLYIHRQSSTDNLRSRYATGTTVVDTTFANFFQSLDNQWIHITLVCDYTNKTAKAYKNGVLFGTNILSGTPPFPSINRVKYIGSYSIASDYITDGSLDEVRIYNRGLSADEVAARYNSTRGRYQ